VYPRSDIDKAWGRGETWPVDPELREALNQVVVDLGGEIRSGDAETREALNQVVVDLRGEIQTLGTELRGEIRSVDADLRGALNQVVVDLRGEIQSLGTELRGEIQSSAAETRDYVDERIQASSTEVRRHFDVVAESLRGDMRAIAEGMVASREQTGRRLDEQAGRTDGLGRRVLRLEVRVTRLAAARKPPRPRRRR